MKYGKILQNGLEFIRKHSVIVEADIKMKIIRAIFKAFKRSGDAKKISGRYKVMDASKGYETYILDNMSIDDLRALAKEKGIKL
jgi:hypothetical protein